MAHKIEAFDTVLATAPTWHKLERIVERIEGFPFEVTAEKLFNADMEEIAGHKAIYGLNDSKAKQLISLQQDSYALIDNKTIFDATVNALDGVKYKIDSCGSIKGGSQVFISIEIEGGEWVAGNGDAHKTRLNVLSSHDGSLPYVTLAGVTRVVCANTVRAALKEGERVARLRHTKNALMKVEGMEAAIASMFKAQAEFKVQMDRLLNTPATALEAERFAVATVASGEVSTRAQNQAEQIASLFARGKGNKGETRYDIFQGVTEFFTHHAGSDSRKMFESSEFGSYAKRKESALENIINGWDDMQAKGKALLAAA